MVLETYSNGHSYKINLYFFKVRLNKIYNLIQNKKYKIFLCQINRFENGYVSVYVRLFYRYSFEITGIKLREGKRFFFGNKDY